MAGLALEEVEACGEEVLVDSLVEELPIEPSADGAGVSLTFVEGVGTGDGGKVGLGAVVLT